MSDRKYTQRGYQDSGDDRRSSRREPRGPRSHGDGPRGRGLGRPTLSVCRCAVCGTEQDVVGIEMGSTCAKCGTGLHTCTHCVHFDPSATYECRQPRTSRVANKAANNDCELFTVRSTRETAGDQAASDPKAAFDALFKGL